MAWKIRKKVFHTVENGRGAPAAAGGRGYFLMEILILPPAGLGAGAGSGSGLAAGTLMAGRENLTAPGPAGLGAGFSSGASTTG